MQKENVIKTSETVYEVVSTYNIGAFLTLASMLYTIVRKLCFLCSAKPTMEIEARSRCLQVH